MSYHEGVIYIHLNLSLSLLSPTADLCCCPLLAWIPPLHTVHTPHPRMKPIFMCKWGNPDVMSKWQLERILHAHIAALNITSATQWRNFSSNIYITHCLWGSNTSVIKKNNYNYQVHPRTPKITLNSNKRPMGLDALLENQLGHLASCTYTPFLPQGSKLSLFSLYEQQFLRYVPICKIAIFGHETWPLA